MTEQLFLYLDYEKSKSIFDNHIENGTFMEVTVNFEELWDDESITKKRGMKSGHKATTNKRLSLTLIFDKNIKLNRQYQKK